MSPVDFSTFDDILKQEYSLSHIAPSSQARRDLAAALLGDRPPRWRPFARRRWATAQRNLPRLEVCFCKNGPGPSCRAPSTFSFANLTKAKR